MKKLVYITCDAWWDTDINILPELGKDFDLEVFCISDKNPAKCKYPQKDLPSNIKFHNCNFRKSRKDPVTILLSFFYFVWIYFSTIGKVTFWVVDNNLFYIYPLLLCISKKRTIISFHNYVEHGDSQRIDNWLAKQELKKMSLFHLQSEGQGLIFAKENPTKKSFFTYMAVKSFGSPKRTERFFNNDKKTFLFFGSAREYKRLDMFIEAAEQFQGSANFIIAGHCSNWDKYKDRTIGNSSLLCNITFIDNEDIPDYFTLSDFLVLPYEDSTQSGPLLIAYNYNLPIIASNLPYFTDMVHDGYDGFIFEKGSQDSLNLAIKEAIDLSSDNYQKLLENLRSTVNEYKNKSDFSNSLKQFIKLNIK